MLKKNNIKFLHRINRVQALIVLKKSYLSYMASNWDTLYIKVIALDGVYKFIVLSFAFEVVIFGTRCDWLLIKSRRGKSSTTKKTNEDDWFVRLMVDSLVTHYYYLTTLLSSLRIKVLCKYGEKSYARIDTLIIKLTRSNKLRN